MKGEALVCQKLGLLTIENELSPKSQHILSQVDKLFVKKSKKKYDTEDFDKKIEEYRNMFPKGMLPSGKPARTNISEIKKKMLDFAVKNISYDWDLILDATEMYIEHFRKDGYKFMKTAGYFISKNDESELAAYCQMILDGEGESKISKSIYNIE